MSDVIFKTLFNKRYPYQAYVDGEMECVAESYEVVRDVLRSKAERMMRKWHDVYMQLEEKS